MLTVLEIIKRTTEFLAAKRIDSPRLNAELLIGHALKLKRMQLYLQFERPLTELELERIRPLVRRRALQEPLQYVLGETEFCGLKLKVDRRALIPRPETEMLVEFVATVVQGRSPLRIVDLGTGTGAIALALANRLPEAIVTATDTSPEALALAEENIAACTLGGRVHTLRSDWFEAVPPADRFEVIVANPPYLSPEETAETNPEVRQFEPAAALTSADAGLADLRAIVSTAPRFLAPGGFIAMETGIGHHSALREIAAGAGFTRFESRQDLTARDRFVLAWRE